MNIWCLLQHVTKFMFDHRHGCTVHRSLLGDSESFEAPRRQCSWKKTSYMKDKSNVYERHSSKALPDVVSEL